MAYDWFTWKGHNCTEYGIHVTQQPEIIRPPKRATFTPVPGHSSTLTTLEGLDVFDVFLLTAECTIKDLIQLNTILAWLKPAFNGRGALPERTPPSCAA